MIHSQCPSVLDVHDEAATCKFMRSRSALVHAPALRPSQFGTTCLSFAREPATATAAPLPQFSVLVNVFNSEAKLRIVLTQLLKLTAEPWELILNFDGCSDGSHQVAIDLMQRAFGKVGSSTSAWPNCPYPLSTVNVSAVWRSGHNLDSHQGDIGRECWLADDLHDARTAPLVSVKFLVTSGAGLFATASDNLKMLASRAPFYILVDDDQFMTTPAWNVKLAFPLRAWSDRVFSASARCAHGYPKYGAMRGPKCANTLALQPRTAGDGRCAFHIADSGNRGPLIIRAAYAHALGYLDEVNYMGVVTTNDDHDLNWRAFHTSGKSWVSGFLPLDYTEERRFRSPLDKGSTVTDKIEAYKAWFFARRKAATKFGISGEQFAANASGMHDEILTIRDGAWAAVCAVQARTK